MITVVHAESRSEAWLKAALKLADAENSELHNLIVEISKPCTTTKSDKETEEWLDELIQGRHQAQPVRTVAQTIFPAYDYRKWGSDGVLKGYMKNTYPLIKKVQQNNRGTYAARILSARKDNGKLINPLEETIKRMRSQLAKKDGCNNGAIRMCYEIPVTSPIDIPINHYDGAVMAFPCLSLISFKLSKDYKSIDLTAVYRSQEFSRKAMGNYLGLAWLLKFFADEVGLEPRNLVCHSTFANLDIPKGIQTKIKERAEKLGDRCDA